MRGETVVGGMVLVALALGACSSGGSVSKMSSKALCENAGGTYAQGSCQPGSAKTAADMCQGYGGIYFTNEDLCHIPIR